MSRTALVLSLVLALSAVAAARDGLRLRAAGALTPPDAESAVVGTFQLDSRVAASGRTSDRVSVSVSGVPVGADTPREGARAVLIGVGGSPRIDLGRALLGSDGTATIRSRRVGRALRERSVDLRTFAGATVEVTRDGGDLLARGTVPEFEAAAAGRSLGLRTVLGRFEALAAPLASPGRFQLRTIETDGEIRNRLLLRTGGIRTAPNSAGVPPDYRARILNDARNRVVDLGALALEPFEGGSLVLDTRRAPLPGGIVRWSEFDGGSLEILLGNSILRRGEIAPLRTGSEDVTPAGRARMRISEGLTAGPTSPGARGVVTANLLLNPGTRRESVVVQALDLPLGLGPHLVLARDAGGLTTTLGSLDLRGPAGFGVLRSRALTRHIPGGLGRLAGQQIEVQDDAGRVLLAGTFPTLD